MQSVTGKYLFVHLILLVWCPGGVVVSGSPAVNFSEPGLRSTRSGEHTISECLNNPRRDEGISGPLKTLSYLDSSVELDRQYLMIK